MTRNDHVIASTEREWRALIGTHIRFDHHQQWEEFPFTHEGVLERVELTDTGDPRYPQIFVSGDWGAVVPDLATRVTLLDPDASTNGAVHRNALGQLHRLDGPAVERDGSLQWRQYGRLHREDGPALIEDVSREWYQFGRLHRTDGPALERDGDVCEWHQFGRLHRTDGPAIELSTGSCQWYLAGSCAPEDVATDWLERHHPDATATLRETLHELCRHWSPGDQMSDLYAAALAAHA